MTANTRTLHRPLPRRTLGLLATALALAFLESLAPPSRVFAAETAGTGVVSGIVTNKTTGNGLLGAVVEIPALRLSTLVDNTGRYLFQGLPAGTHEVVVNYTGMDTQRSRVNVTGGQAAVQNFELTSPVLTLDAFKVAAEKEGLSAALTQQRNADNLKSVASMDALRDLPNMNATELAIRLPGVSFANPGDEVVEVVSVRGTGAGMTSITIDGGGMSSFSAQNRNTRMTAFTGAMFESLEVVKGQTPDRSVDSLGGNVNFRTRSPLSMREKRRVSYSLTARMAPYFSEQVPLREAHRSHLLFNGSYQEKFAVFGSETENLAVSVNAFYSENAFGFFRSLRDFQQTNTAPAFLWDYRTMDNYNNRKQRSISTKWDYRLTRNNLLKLNLIYNDAPEPMRRQYEARAYTGATNSVPSATSTATGVVPGWTDRVTTVRALTPTGNASSTPNSAIDVTSTLINRDQRLRDFTLGGEHKFGPFDADWDARWSRTRYRYLGAEGSLVNRLGGVPFRDPAGAVPTTAFNTVPLRGPNNVTGVGWIIDRTESDMYPRFSQNGGLDFTNPAYYRPAFNGLSTQSGNLDIDLIKELKGNIRYKLPFESFTAHAKIGGAYRNHTDEHERRNRRWNYIGTDALTSDPSILMWDTVKTGRRIPMWQGAGFIQNGQPVNPSLWREDLYFYESNRLSASTKAVEQITGYYAMVQGRFGANGFLGGLRRETTETTAWATTRTNGTQASAVEQYFSADPIALARRDFGRPFRTQGKYGQNFPSFHAWRDLTPNIKARGSWSTGFARPSLGDVLPALSINESASTISMGNPELRPQKAKNWDFSLEFYLPHSSSFSVTWFHKTIDDFWLSSQRTGETVGSGLDNGFNGQYPGYAILQKINGGTAINQGWEISYLQQFRFLPSLFRGLRVSANYSPTQSHGTFSGGEYLKQDQVQNFIPRTGNLALMYDYKKFGATMSYNYTSSSIRTAFNSANPSRNQYLAARELVNLTLRYQLARNLTVTFGVANLFNEPQIYYRTIGATKEVERWLVQGTTITGGLEGRF